MSIKKKCEKWYCREQARYRCKNCCYNYTVKKIGKYKEIKKMALLLYLEGLGLRLVGIILGVSQVSVMNWIKHFGEKLEGLKSDNKLELIEMDKMHTYIGSKKTIVGYGLLLTNLEKNLSAAFLVHEGLRQGKKLWDKVKEKEIKKIATDHWKAYETFILQEKHIQSKERCTVEGYNIACSLIF